MATKLYTFLMFEGRCEEALNLYVSLFPGAEIVSLVRYGEGGPGKPGRVQQAIFTLEGREFRAFDSPVAHAFTFTPAVSIFVDCESEGELDTLYGALLEGGEALMGLGDYGFSRKFGWVNDRFGVSWQLNLPA
jgi:predicted 3-demethylubiquinone-9 3-methyltransferase (glyoxalase superfamily)